MRKKKKKTIVLRTEYLSCLYSVIEKKNMISGNEKRKLKKKKLF